MSTFGQNGSEKGLKGSFRPFSRVSHQGGGKGGDPLLSQSRTYSQGGPPLAPPRQCPCRKNFPKAPFQISVPTPSKSGAPPPSEMNLFLYDFLEITRFYTVNFPFIKLFFQKNSSFFFQKPIFKHGRPPSPPSAIREAPHLPQFRRPPHEVAALQGSKLTPVFKIKSAS